MMDARRLPLLIRIALRAHPRRFRDEFAEEIEEDVREALSEQRTRWGVLRTTVAQAALLVRSGCAERLRPTVAAARGPAVRNGGAGRLDTLVADLRVTIRSLARRPGFSAIAVITLALGIGANTAVFSVVHAVLLRPLPWQEPDGLLRIWAYAQDPDARGAMSQPDIEDISGLPGIEKALGYRPAPATVTEGQEPELIAGARATDGLLSVFRVQPVLGRDLTREDNDPGAQRVVVLGHGFWQERYGGRRDVLGETIELTGEQYEIVGVAPPGFDFPSRAQLWWSWRLDLTGCARGCHTMLALARLAQGATLEAVIGQVDALASSLSQTHPQTNTGKGFRALRLADDQVADVRDGLIFILGAVGLVLLIACANVANLMLVRGESRRSEVAVRAALGASRVRLASQVLMESAVLSVAGGLVGLAIARAGIQLARALPQGTVPRIEEAGLDGSVLLYSAMLAVLVTVIFGLSPALQQSRGESSANPVSEQRAGHRQQRSRTMLIVVEVALSVVLLVGAGLLLKTFDRLYRVDMGFTPDPMTRFRISLPESRYDTLPRVSQFFDELEQRLAALPGVLSVGSGFGPPLNTARALGEVRVEGRPVPEPGQEQSASMHGVTPGYRETIGIPLQRGRWIEASDRVNTPGAAVVSESFVREIFPGEDPLGKRFEMTLDFGWGSPLWTIVGVVGDVHRSPTEEPVPAVYVPVAQFGPEALTITMRTAGITPSQAAIRDIVRSLDPGLPLREFETVRDAMRREVAPTRFYLMAMATFAGLAVVLACIGLYGVVGYLVSRRTREIGIRIALGARTDRVLRMIVAQGLAPALSGLVIGMLLALALGRVAESLLFQVSPRDPLIMAGVALLLVLATLTAVFIPALRASRVHPVEALRGELL